MEPSPGQLCLLFRNELEKVIILSVCRSSAPAGGRGAGRLCHVGGRDPSTSRLCGPPLAPPPSHGERAQGNPGKRGWAPAASGPFSEGMHTPTLGSGDRQRLEAFLGDLDTREESFLVGPDWEPDSEWLLPSPLELWVAGVPRSIMHTGTGSEGREDLLKATATAAELKRPSVFS